MRLFGIPGGTLNKARSTYGFMDPFDLALSNPSPPATVVPSVPQFDAGGGKQLGGGLGKGRLPRRTLKKDKVDPEAERLERIIREEEEIIGLL